MLKTKIESVYEIISAPSKWYHGTGEDMPIGRLKKGKKWVAFDGKQIDEPFWLAPNIKFAKLHGSKVYECEIHIANKDIFGDRPYTREGRYWKDMAINEGKLVYDALERGDLFKDAGNFEQVFKAIIAEDYDIIETKEFIDWAKSLGFKAAYVQGDGERNLMVFDPTLVEVVGLVS